MKSIEERWLTTTGWQQVGEGTAISKSLAASYTSPALDVLHFDLGSMVATWSGVDVFDGVLNLQGSLDNTNWADLPGMVRSVSQAADSEPFHIDIYGLRFIRLVYTRGTATTGTLNIRTLFKA